MTVADAARRLAEAGVASAATDAELLAAHVLGIPRADARGRGDTAAWDAEQRRTFDALVARRAERVPLQHLTGVAPFRYIEARVGPGVFVPRPETELMVDLAGELLGRLPRRPGLPAPSSHPAHTMIDLCSGSAALTVSLAIEFPGSDVHGVEVSPPAQEWARRTLAAYEAEVAAVKSGVTLHTADVRTPVEGLPAADLVVTNPPYVPPEATPVDPEVARHDPSLALYGGGGDGLELPAVVVARAAEILRPGGWLICEHAEEQGAAMRRLFAAGGKFDSIETRRDLASRPRFTIGKAARH